MPALPLFGDSSLIPEAYSLDTYDWAGSMATYFPPHDRWGEINIVSGVQRITHSILAMCLYRKGEDPIHPAFGLAPDIFDPLSNYKSQYWVYNLQSEIEAWQELGLQAVEVSVEEYTQYQNKLTTRIRFIPKIDPNPHVLTFGYFEYQGAIWNNSPGDFRSSVRLDNNPFFLTADKI